MRSWAWWFGLLAAIARARELDPAACASRFDVQREKIIRTEESREMGARYLSELDVGGRHECLRLCCETDSCDVFIYEEKNPGSCYLFNCGPPEDFRCKFTAHSNFSSGVLALSRRLAELQDQERLSQHEQELTHLRTWASTTPKTTAATTASPRPAPHAPPHPQTTPRRCSRYQFECHTGGECIAVYNACDGIAQCADGSDEAPELGCPSAPPLETAQAVTTTTAATPPPAKPLQESSDSSASEALVPAEGGALGAERWPHRLTQAQPQHKYETGPSSHIFSHKGGLLQEPDNSMTGIMGQYPAFEAPWPRRPWAQQLPAMEGVDRWGPGMGPAGGPGAYQRYEWPEPDPRRAWPVPQPRPEPEMPVYMPPKTMPETVNIYSNQHTLRDSPKKGFDLVQKVAPPVVVTERVVAPPVAKETDKQPPVETTTKKKELKIETVAPKPAPAESTKKTAAHVAEHQHFTSADEHDGLSEHPPAAVMLLVLGILMTTVMGVMLGCRARAARRRLRRGKSPFAHDADYLVNGMYL